MRQKTRLLTLLVLLAAVVTGAWAQTGMINGLFSVSPTKRVYFSKGNLQYDGTNWKFAENQWEVLGANGTGATGTATNYPMDFFTWGNIDSPTYNGTTYYTENADLSGITDWGSRMGSGWYTLSKDEWLYLFGMESSNTDKSGHARYRKYFRAKVNGLQGIVLLPDDLSGISDIPAESSRGTASNFAKTYTTDAWSAMESAGCVFLPTAGFRKTDASVSHVGWSGFYWESTAYDAGKAYTVGFDNTFVDPAGNFDRTFGFAVRLVIDQYYLTLADGVKDADKWTVKVGDGEAQALPIGGLKGDGSETVTLQYTGRLKVKNVTATTDAGPVWDGDLSKLTAESTAEFATATDGMTISGTLAANVKVSIAAGATVTLDGVTINGVSTGSYKWAGLNCLGNATIVLKDGTTNTVKGFHEDYPGIHVPAGSKLTIQGGTEGTGKLTASPFDGGTGDSYGAGIGGGYSTPCGDIDIQGGDITATGGSNAAGIGGGKANCGNISIEGGTVTATGGYKAAGIGGGRDGSCGNITITNGVTRVTATKGQDAPYSIGAGYNDGNGGTCGTVTIGGTKYWEDNAALNDGATYLATSPIVYPKEPATVTTAPTGAAVVGVGKTTALVSGGAADGGKLMYQMTTTYTMPTSTDGFSASVPTAQTITASGKVYVWYYVKADDTHTDSEIAVTEVPVADIVWDVTNVSDLSVQGDYQSYEKEGVKLSGNAEQIYARCYVFGDPLMDGIGFDANESGGFTFTAPTGKAFTKIEMKALGSSGWDFANLGTGWESPWDNPTTVTWKGDSAASTVGLLTDADNFHGQYISYIAFYLSE